MRERVLSPVKRRPPAAGAVTTPPDDVVLPCTGCGRRVCAVQSPPMPASARKVIGGMLASLGGSLAQLRPVQAGTVFGATGTQFSRLFNVRCADCFVRSAPRQGSEIEGHGG